MPPVPALSLISQYDLAFQISPIFLSGGIAAQTQGQLAPITTYTGNIPQNVDESIRYVPIPGSTLISQTVGMYPFANQVVAANATIKQPLTLSMLMLAPVNQPGGYQRKLSLFSNLQASLAQHNALGGTYIIATPAYIYYDCLMISMTDSTTEDDNQQQIQWQIDFLQPLLTQAAASAVYGAWLAQVTAGTQIVGTPSWSGNAASSPANLAGQTGALGNVTAALAEFGGTV